MSGGRVVGVDAHGPHGPLQVTADRVVLTAGAIGTAHLLMLSGIGPADELRTLGVTVHADLPVGRATWDHPEWLVPTDWPASERAPVLEAVLQHDDLEIRPYTTGFGASTLSVGVALMRPRARGRLTLVSDDPAVAPRIEHRYDSEPADIAALRRGCRVVSEIIGPGVRDEPVWGTSQHLAGTAPIGFDDAVVDPTLRVHGVGNLWVADGSVLPTPLSRGPHATITALAHRAAEFLK